MRNIIKTREANLEKSLVLSLAYDFKVILQNLIINAFVRKKLPEIFFKKSFLRNFEKISKAPTKMFENSYSVNGCFSSFYSFF